MTELREELKEDILEKFYHGELEKLWSKGIPDYDLNCDEIEIKIEPNDAEKINEVEFFTTIEYIMDGSIQTKYTRKK